jgi:DNA-binding NarL/FixJ family response regulator
MELAFERFGQDTLSPREQMVVQLILRGHSAHSIARSLEIAEGTVKNHRKSIYAKLGISSQQELFSRFIRSMLQ